MARSLGIKNRDIAILLVEKSGNQSGKDFIKWLSNLTINDINRFELNPYDTKNILSVALKLTPHRNQHIESVDFYIRGTSYVEEWKNTSLLVEVNDILGYERDEDNKNDPFAIKISKDENDLGFVPREYAKNIAVEIDLSETKYEISVLDTNILDNRKSILVRMNRIAINL